jgi:hypothetical protein
MWLSATKYTLVHKHLCSWTTTPHPQVNKLGPRCVQCVSCELDIDLEAGTNPSDLGHVSYKIGNQDYK